MLRDGGASRSLSLLTSMSDLFHPEVPAEFIARVFGVMNECPRHTFQVLTKRSARLRELASSLTWTSNIWMGVSVESSRVLERVVDLRKVNSHVRFLSVEPLLGPIEKLPLDGIHWVIVGGESGPGARPMKQEWVQSILRQCRAAGVSFFFKQWGGTRKAKTGRLLNGRTYDEKPTVIQLAASPA